MREKRPRTPRKIIHPIQCQRARPGRAPGPAPDEDEPVEDEDEPGEDEDEPVEDEDEPV